VEGPLSIERIQQLEPFANWQLKKQHNDDESRDEGATYLFPDEGCVDPIVAVQTLRRVAEERGVHFVANQNVTKVLRDEQTGIICGVESTTSEDMKPTFTPADLVVVAAGVGAAAPSLGGLPLLHRPGQISYALPKSESPRRLSRILVDPLRSSHVMQRPDGSIVAGGGALVSGGSSGTLIFSSKTKDSEALLEGAKELSPSIVNQAEFTHSSKAVRPMPSDGLPIVGYLQQGLYAIVTHSGITLGPVLSALAAGELDENISCNLLTPYRPSRFQNTTELGSNSC